MENKEPKEQYPTKRVLIVEDVGVMRQVIQDMLKSNNKYLVFYTAENGESAIKLLSKVDIIPDIIIMDLNMPGMDGVEATELIRKNPRTKNIPILVCTARNERTDIMQMSKFGIRGYLIKPFTTQSMQKKFYEVLQIEPPKPEEEVKKLTRSRHRGLSSKIKGERLCY